MPSKQRRRQPAEDLRRDALGAARGQAGRANRADGLRPGRHRRLVESASLDPPGGRRTAGRRSVLRHGPVDRLRDSAAAEAVGAAGCPTTRFRRTRTVSIPDTGRPRTWPMRLAMVHWAGVHPGLPAGKYDCAAAPSTNKATASRCRARFANRATRRSKKCDWPSDDRVRDGLRADAASRPTFRLLSF